MDEEMNNETRLCMFEAMLKAGHRIVCEELAAAGTHIHKEQVSQRKSNAKI